MVSFRPLGDSELRVFQGIITLDGNNVNVLVDAGWDELLTPSKLDSLVEHIDQIDVILLTHASIGHTGAFCYLRHKFPEFRAIPCYATLPVIRMSQMMTLDVYRQAGLCGEFDNSEALSAEKVENIWSEVHNVKYSQPLQLHATPKLEGTTITAYNAGHSLGGSLWKLWDGVDSIVVAYDWNHSRDAHLSGAFLEPKTGTLVPDLQKPSLFITSTDVNSGLPLTKARQKFIGNIEDAISKGGTVLIPTSSGSRVLELMLILGKQLSTGKLTVPLIYYSSKGKQTINQASSMLEWMVPSIISDWQVQNESPFDAARIHYVSDLESILKNWPQGPKIILASGECLESGPSKEVFVKLIAQDHQSSVILTEFCPKETLGYRLLQLKNEMSNKDMEDGILVNLKRTLDNVTLDIQEPLQGEALLVFKKKKEDEERLVIEAVSRSRRNQELIDAAAAAQDDSSDSDSEDNNGQLETEGPGRFIIDPDVYDYECKPDDKQLNRMFPFNVKKRRTDDYGDCIPQGLFTVKKPLPMKKEKHAHESTINSDSGTLKLENTTGTDDSEMQGHVDQKDSKGENPVRLVTKEIPSIKLKCWISFVDMNGVTNLRSLQMILKQLQPERVIAIPGSAEVVDYLRKSCAEFALADENVTFERKNFSVDVRIDPNMKVKWHNLYGGYSVARVSGNLEFDPNDQTKRFGAVLVSPPENDELTKAPKKMIGDLKLTSLRKVLMDQGMKVEYQGQGGLICNDKVTVRKVGDGTYILEGGLEPEYYIVRAAIRRFVSAV